MLAGLTGAARLSVLEAWCRSSSAGGRAVWWPLLNWLELLYPDRLAGQIN
jgi:hypothetical protein